MRQCGKRWASSACFGWGRIVVLSHLRFAAGVCVLAAGLLMGAGGAVAAADPGSSGSAAHGDDGTNAPGQQHSAGAKKPKDEPVGTDTNDGSLGSGGQSGQQHSAGAKKPKDEPVGTDTNDGSLGSGGQSGQQHSAGAKKPKDEPVGADTQDEEKGSGVTGTVPNVVVAPVTDVVAAPVTNLVAPSDLQLRERARATALRPFFLLVGHRRGAARRGRSGRHPRPWAVGSRGCVGGVAIAAGPALCRCLGRAGGRQRNQGCNARCDCARSSVSAVRDGTANAQWRLSGGCGVVFPACFRRTPANRFSVGAGRCRSARHRRACDPYRSRGARPIRQANVGFASRTSGIAGFAHPAGR